MAAWIPPDNIGLQQHEELPVAREQRKLAAILAADVVGYSRLMGRDKSDSLTRLCGNAIATQRGPAHI